MGTIAYRGVLEAFMMIIDLTPILDDTLHRRFVTTDAARVVRSTRLNCVLWQR